MHNTDALLKPRYKVILDYLRSEFKVGQILYFHKVDGGFAEGCYQLTEMFAATGNIYLPGDIENYPDHFKKLYWWEDRKPEDMPAFVKYWDVSMYFPTEHVCKGTEAPFGANNFTAENFRVATEAEYLTYLKSRE